MPAGTPESAPRSDLSCGRIPPTPGYGACSRTVGHEGPCAHPLAAQEPSELEKLVQEMRRLGVSEYTNGQGIRIVLGSPAMPEATEKTEAEQQRIRDDRERRELERKRRILFGASSRIGPPLGEIK